MSSNPPQKGNLESDSLLAVFKKEVASIRKSAKEEARAEMIDYLLEAIARFRFSGEKTGDDALPPSGQKSSEAMCLSPTQADMTARPSFEGLEHPPESESLAMTRLKDFYHESVLTGKIDISSFLKLQAALLGAGEAAGQK